MLSKQTVMLSNLTLDLSWHTVCRDCQHCDFPTPGKMWSCATRRGRLTWLRGEGGHLWLPAGKQAVHAQAVGHSRQTVLARGRRGCHPTLDSAERILGQGQGVQGCQVVLQRQAMHRGGQGELAHVGLQQWPPGLRWSLEPHCHCLLPCNAEHGVSGPGCKACSCQPLVQSAGCLTGTQICPGAEGVKDMRTLADLASCPCGLSHFCGSQDAIRM